MINGSWSWFRAANNSRSTDNVRSKIGFVWSNPLMAGQLFVRLFTLAKKKFRVSSFKYLKVQYYWRLWKRRGKDGYLTTRPRTFNKWFVVVIKFPAVVAHFRFAIHQDSRHRKLAGLTDVYRSRVWITLLLVHVGFVNMMWKGQQNLSVSVRFTLIHKITLICKIPSSNCVKSVDVDSTCVTCCKCTSVSLYYDENQLDCNPRFQG